MEKLEMVLKEASKKYESAVTTLDSLVQYLQVEMERKELADKKAQIVGVIKKLIIIEKELKSLGI
jgi:hypothetical protein